MIGLLRRAAHGLTRGFAATSPSHSDGRLRGRTYAIPFEHVWRAALELAGGGLPRSRVVEADDDAGVIRAEARPLVLERIDDLTIRIRLDRDAQTRVDARSESRTGRGDLGANARRVARFFRELDRALERRG